MSEQEQSKLVRYCPECGRIGEVTEGFRDCCPDGSHHCYVPEAIAKQAHAGFQAYIYPQPREENILRSHGDWYWYGPTAGDMVRHHAEIVEDLAASTPSAQNHAQGEDRKDAERWQPIETAPKSSADGRSVSGIYLLGFCPEPDMCDLYSAVCVIWWEPLMKGGKGMWYGEGGFEVHPTHWMPLPEHPAMAARETK